MITYSVSVREKTFELSECRMEDQRAVTCSFYFIIITNIYFD